MYRKAQHEAQDIKLLNKTWVDRQNARLFKSIQLFHFSIWWNKFFFGYIIKLLLYLFFDLFFFFWHIRTRMYIKKKTCVIASDLEIHIFTVRSKFFLSIETPFTWIDTITFFFLLIVAPEREISTKNMFSRV